MRNLLLILLIALASLVTSGRAHAQQTDIIRGRVTGAPPDTGGIQGVRVRVTSYYGNVTREDVTKANGSFSILVINGEGDYWIEFTKIGFQPVRREIKKVGNEEVMIANQRMQSTIARLDTVSSSAPRPGARALPNRNAVDPDVGGGGKSLIGADVAADQIGNLAAMAATIAGVQIIPGLDGAPDMYSVLGLSGDQNNTTFNGVGSDINVLPPDIIAKATINPYNFDVASGGYSGGQISIQTQPGSNFSQRRLSHTNILPTFEWTDATAAAQAQKFTSLRVGGNAAGPIVLDKAFYNIAYNVSRRASDARTLLNTSPFGLSAAGVAYDSASRFRDILFGHGVPLSAGGPLRVLAQEGGQATANFDFIPSRSGTGGSFTFGLAGNYSKTNPVGAGNLLLSTPTHAGSSTRWGGSSALKHTSYFDVFGVGILTQTTVGGGANRTTTTPYIALPEGMVRVRSTLGDSTSPVRSLLFGGSPAESENRSTSMQINNSLSWYSMSNKHSFKLATSVARSAYSNESSSNTLGRFTFNSLADLGAGRASAYSRTLTNSTRAASQVVASASLGDYWRPILGVQVQYGVRVDANRFMATPAYNALVEEVFGVRNDRSPNNVYVSPRIGFQWAYGTAPTVAASAGAFRPPAAIIHGGIGVFQNLGGPQLIGGPLTNTGLASSTQTMACVGDAVPVPDWTTYLTDLDAIPRQCADGSAGTVFSTASPSVSLFDASYRQPRSLRGALDWSGPILDNRFMFGVQTVVTHAPNQQGSVDLNFDPATEFTLLNEGGRPVFAAPSAIVAGTGAIAPGDARMSSAFQRVSATRSELQLDSRLVNIGISPITSNRLLRWNLRYTLLDADESYYGFSSTVGNPLDIERATALSSGRQSLSLGWSNFPIFDFVYVSTTVRMQSGSRYTPRIAGDVNGDGMSNDRAFVFDPTAEGGDPAVAAGIQSLLDGGSASARTCLMSQLGALADRGSCKAPWTTTASLGLRFNPAKIHLPKRATLSIQVQNPMALADLALHGSNDIRGWGQAVQPDQTLLFVRGFDPATKQFKYDVNQRFGSTRRQQNTSGATSYLSIGLTVDIGMPRERQTLSQRLDAGRGRPGARSDDRAIWQLGVASIPNPMSLILQADSALKLTQVQADSLAWLSHLFAVYADSTWTPAARNLAALPEAYDRGEAYSTYVRAREKTVDYLLTLIPHAKGILTASQKRKLPPQITSYLDERVLKFLRSSSAGDPSALVR